MDPIDPSKLPPLPAEKPQIKHGYLSDVNVYPVIVNFSHILRWMWTHWGEGGGGQQESVEFDLRTYFGVDSIVDDPTGDISTADRSVFDQIIEAYKAGKKVYLLDTKDCSDLGNRVEFKYEVEFVHEPTDGDGRLFISAHGPTLIAGEGGISQPKLVIQDYGSGDKPIIAMAMM